MHSLAVRLLLACWLTLAGLAGGSARAASISVNADAANATTYPWIDIASSGSVLTLADDAVSAALPLGFGLALGGTTYTAVRVQSNGLLQFGATSIAAVTHALPLDGSGSKPAIDAVLLPLWDDLLPSGGELRTHAQGSAPNRVFVVSWNAVPYYGGSYQVCDFYLFFVCVAAHTVTPTATFQVQLHEQGAIVFRYGAVHGSGGSHGNPSGSNFTNPGGATVGIEISDTDHVQYARNSAVLAAGTTLVWTAVPAASTLHHLELQHASGSSLTCNTATLTLRACADAACSTPHTAGLSGTLSASGATVNWPDGAGFSIASGSSTTTLRLQQTSAGTSLIGASGLTPAAGNATSCSFGSPACTWTAADSGLVFDLPHHASEAVQTISVAAVKKSDSSSACVPAFASTSRSIGFSCSYSNPASGSLPVRVGGSALNAANSAAAACDSGGRAVTLAFNASGVASTTVQYADVGQLLLSARYAGSGSEAGLVMTGSASFIAAPAAFGFSAVSAAPLRAGIAFSATVSARNSAGATAPNFGQESTPERATLAFSRRQPTGAGASDGVFSGSLGGFAGGSASAANLVWSEVGSGDLGAALASASYLGSGLTATGTTGSAGAVGPFIPHHFDLVATPACSGVFSYAGQPFAVSVIARNGSSPAGTTVNYDGSSATTPNQAGTVTLTDAGSPGLASLGSLGAASVPASAFRAGIASASPVFSFSSKTTAAQVLGLRASNGASGSSAVSSAGYTEASMPLRSGRLRLSNAFGSAGAALQLPVVAEYWSGNSWVLNSADSCTTLAAASVALSNPRGAGGAASTATSSAGPVSLSAGSGLLRLAAPSPAGSSLSLDLALNLGSGSADQSCQPNHPASTGAARPWLRAQNGSCATSADRDPAARASFGLYSPESRKLVHLRSLF